MGAPTGVRHAAPAFFDLDVSYVTTPPAPLKVSLSLSRSACLPIFLGFLGQDLSLGASANLRANDVQMWRISCVVLIDLFFGLDPSGLRIVLP
jgi:hypothetical protein